MTDSVANPIADRLAVSDVIVRYAACIDDRDFDAYRSCFGRDVELHGFAADPIRGVDAWLKFVGKALEGFAATQHLLGPPAVTVSGDTASLRADVQAQHFFTEPRGRILTLWGTYRSELVRGAGGWHIERHQLDTRATRISDAYRS
jgi:ketosteroid isomerase-like protein